MAEYHPATHGDMDVIFVGGGTSACVTAGRLASANPDLKILLVEGGKNNHEDPTVRNPAAFLSHLVPDSQTAVFYKSKASEALNGREAIVPTGGLLGGGSSINFMMYTRAQGIDFDSWKTPGWGAKDMAVMCNRAETFHQDESGINKDMHGYNGPIHVSDGGFRGRSEMKSMEAIKAMGYDELVDLQDFQQNGGFSRWQRYVNKEGQRQDTAHCYIHPLLQGGKHPNLHILTERKVVRVLFDQSSPPRATGVEIKPNKEHQPELSLSKPKHETIKANKLVVVSAGALGSPQILERSGIGNSKILSKLDVPTVADVPGVGENYQDHNLILYPYKTSLEPEETLDGLWSGRKEFPKAMAEKDPQLGWNAIDICAKLRMTEADRSEFGPEFEEEWQRDFGSSPTRPDMLCGVVNGFLGDHSTIEPGQHMTMGTYSAYPYARGSIHITSPDDVLNGYDFDTGFLTHKSDVQKLVWAYKMSRELARRLPYYKGELEMGHPKFPEGSQAAVGPAESVSASSAAGNIKYSKEDDAAIEDWVRGNANTTWHSLGTCAMKPRCEGGVVDGNLNVYGTRGLKVADLSIVPENVGANTNNTAIAVGEKAADIIVKEFGLSIKA